MAGGAGNGQFYGAPAGVSIGGPQVAMPYMTNGSGIAAAAGGGGGGPWVGVVLGSFPSRAWQLVA